MQEESNSVAWPNAGVCVLKGTCTYPLREQGRLAALGGHGRGPLRPKPRPVLLRWHGRARPWDSGQSRTKTRGSPHAAISGRKTARWAQLGHTEGSGATITSAVLELASQKPPRLKLRLTSANPDTTRRKEVWVLGARGAKFSGYLARGARNSGYLGREAGSRMCAWQVV